jgi:hypothetical protein
MIVTRFDIVELALKPREAWCCKEQGATRSNLTTPKPLPSLYRTKNQFHPPESDMAFIVSGLMCLYAPPKGPAP